jgi:uncharacterized protein (TIGR03086 family)
MANPDLGPAAQRMAALVQAVPDDALGAPTPCADYTLGDLLGHVCGLAAALQAVAAKDLGDVTRAAPSGDATQLPPGWRARAAEDLERMAEAWRDPAAWEGMTQAGGVDLPGAEAGLVALDELVVHGWDVARATGQPYELDDPSLQAVHDWLAQFPPGEEDRGGIYAAAVEVPEGAPLLDRVVALAGRDPRWSPG